jgi:hypothetical protein
MTERDNERERLYYLFQENKCPMRFLDNKEILDTVDYLIANGVIVPPCKVRQTVFRIVRLYGDIKPIIDEGEVFEIALTHENGEIKKRFYFLEKGGNKIIDRYSLWLDFDEIGKTVFLTREEAEKALKEREGI